MSNATFGRVLLGSIACGSLAFILVMIATITGDYRWARMAATPGVVAVALYLAAVRCGV